MLLCTMKAIDTNYWSLVLHTDEGQGNRLTRWDFATTQFAKFAKEKHFFSSEIKTFREGTAVRLCVKENYTQICWALARFGESAGREIKYMEI